jgi:hypothetical protein
MNIPTTKLAPILRLAAILFVALPMADSGDNVLPPSYYMEVHVMSVTRIHSGHFLIEASLQYNGTNECFRISEFSFNNVIRAGIFFTAAGKVWNLASRKGVIEDPPPVKYDYRTELHHGERTAIQFEFEGLFPFGTTDSDGKFSDKFPTLLNYRLFGQVRATSCAYSSPQWIMAAGEGDVKVKLSE